MESFPPPKGVSPDIYAARCYISMWFIDLYVSIRKDVRKLPAGEFHERYQGKLFFFISREYDNYLTLLNASIRPTHVKHAIDNARYIPIIADSIDVNNPSPFGINNFTRERDLFYGLTHIMKTSRIWRFAPLFSDANGRPWWLFDWHFKDHVCSWFPCKDNYDPEDVTLAYILGTACTPNLGDRDVDEWQYFAEGVVPHGDPNPGSYDRVDERRFYGSYEVRTMEIDPEFSLARMLAPILSQVDPNIAATVAERGTTPTTTIKLRWEEQSSHPDIAITRNEEPQEGDQPMPLYKLVDQTTPRFRLIDWVYYCRVIRQMDNETRAIAHGIMSLA
ncbi:unnamed protein product [Lactuca saligna]|uniref:Uncharacterized protein n=1 Tax=Lactuca saligna TaxID=75948 RepID=A0AA35YKW1_LACSI|nr:unnamed protein product [Lactuca saligna]